MADGTSYRKNPIISLVGITVLKDIVYELSKDFAYSSLKSSYMRTNYQVSALGDTSANYDATTYDTSLKITLLITYWNDEGTANGLYQCVVLYPYNSYETDMMKNQVDVPIVDAYIKSIKIILSYTGDKNSATFNYVKLKPSMTTEEVVSGSYSTNVSLRAVHTYNNGCKLFYDNDDNPLTLVFKGDTSGELVAIDVLDLTDTPTRTINITKVAEDISEV